MSLHRHKPTQPSDKFYRMYRRKTPSVKKKEPTPPPQYLDPAALEERSVVLTAEEAERFIEYCENPPEPNEELLSMMQEYLEDHGEFPCN